MWTHANRVKRTGRVARTRRRSLLEPSWPFLEQAANRFTTVAARPGHLVEQLSLGPGRQTTAVPFAQNRKCIVIGQVESADDAAADAEGVNIPVLASDRRRNSRRVLACALDGIAPGINWKMPMCGRFGRRRRWKVRRSKQAPGIPILH
mgnify:CR=1 FL=1